MTNQEFLPARGAPKNTIAEQLDPQRRRGRHTFESSGVQGLGSCTS
jgi:hypothetical protein